MNLLMWPERLLFRSENERKENDVDQLDRAQELAAQFNERCLAEHMRQTRHSMPVSPVRYCDDCGCHIPRERLVILPDAVCCVDCQEQREARHVDRHY